ncbi:MAG: pyridoxamine 5'-phosphate oxidase family protein [Ruminococcus sp.]|uniref:pyridoxamine 5'-phosphate oxidase family protein n=1 Tax=Ruminococcus sp. TaxID=41978 RepID=UPI0025CEC0F0|nr:pyridoxamine 5'-phosphate oxidase family protein [Ruminococcus sp.]MCR4794318.1 pyridoxamine 5'-phosphate oxidase family protein [Ruminococcus sp.]
MRRNDREITDRSEIDRFISGEKILRVGFWDNGEVYIVPVNYGYAVDDGRYTFYFHGAMAGRKYELAQARPTVGFEIDGRYEIISADTACGHSARYQSVIGTGELSLIEDSDEKKAALEYVMKQTAGRMGLEYSEEVLSRTAVFKIEVKTLSCKAK